jgi:preprotein translocase SecE subunit
MGFFERVKQFVHEVAGEFRRVSWPNRAEVVNSTVVVGLSWIVERVLRWG